MLVSPHLAVVLLAVKVLRAASVFYVPKLMLVNWDTTKPKFLKLPNLNPLETEILILEPITMLLFTLKRCK